MMNASFNSTKVSFIHTYFNADLNLLGIYLFN